MIGTNVGDYVTIQHVSIIYLLIYLLHILSIYLFNINQWLQHILVIIKQYSYLNDIKCVHSFLQYQLMIATNIGDYVTIQMVSIIYLLIHLLN